MKRSFTGFFDRQGKNICCGDVIRADGYDSIVLEYTEEKHPIAMLPTEIKEDFEPTISDTLEWMLLKQKNWIDNLWPHHRLAKHEQRIIDKEPKTILEARIIGDVNNLQECPWVYAYYTMMQKHCDCFKADNFEPGDQIMKSGYKEIVKKYAGQSKEV
jgi:hypothetical protein